MQNTNSSIISRQKQSHPYKQGDIIQGRPAFFDYSRADNQVKLDADTAETYIEEMNTVLQDVHEKQQRLNSLESQLGALQSKLASDVAGLVELNGITSIKEFRASVEQRIKQFNSHYSELNVLYKQLSKQQQANISQKKSKNEEEIKQKAAIKTSMIGKLEDIFLPLNSDLQQNMYSLRESLSSLRTAFPMSQSFESSSYNNSKQQFYHTFNLVSLYLQVNCQVDQRVFAKAYQDAIQQLLERVQSYERKNDKAALHHFHVNVTESNAYISTAIKYCHESLKAFEKTLAKTVELKVVRMAQLSSHAVSDEPGFTSHVEQLVRESQANDDVLGQLEQHLLYDSLPAFRQITTDVKLLARLKNKLFFVALQTKLQRKGLARAKRIKCTLRSLLALIARYSSLNPTQALAHCLPYFQQIYGTIHQEMISKQQLLDQYAQNQERPPNEELVKVREVLTKFEYYQQFILKSTSQIPGELECAEHPELRDALSCALQAIKAQLEIQGDVLGVYYSLDRQLSQSMVSKVSVKVFLDQIDALGQFTLEEGTFEWEKAIQQERKSLEAMKNYHMDLDIVLNRVRQKEHKIRQVSAASNDPQEQQQAESVLLKYQQLQSQAAKVAQLEDAAKQYIEFKQSMLYIIRQDGNLILDHHDHNNTYACDLHNEHQINSLHARYLKIFEILDQQYHKNFEATYPHLKQRKTCYHQLVTHYLSLLSAEELYSMQGRISQPTFQRYDLEEVIAKSAWIKKLNKLMDKQFALISHVKANFTEFRLDSLLRIEQHFLALNRFLHDLSKLYSRILYVQDLSDYESYLEEVFYNTKTYQELKDQLTGAIQPSNDPLHSVLYKCAQAKYEFDMKIIFDLKEVQVENVCEKFDFKKEQMYIRRVRKEELKNQIKYYLSQPEEVILDRDLSLELYQRGDEAVVEKYSRQLEKIVERIRTFKRLNEATQEYTQQFRNLIKEAQAFVEQLGGDVSKLQFVLTNSRQKQNGFTGILARIMDYQNYTCSQDVQQLDLSDHTLAILDGRINDLRDFFMDYEKLYKRAEDTFNQPNHSESSDALDHRLAQWKELAQNTHDLKDRFAAINPDLEFLFDSDFRALRKATDDTFASFLKLLHHELDQVQSKLNALNQTLDLYLKLNFHAPINQHLLLTFLIQKQSKQNNQVQGGDANANGDAGRDGQSECFQVSNSVNYFLEHNLLFYKADTEQFHFSSQQQEEWLIGKVTQLSDSEIEFRFYWKEKHNEQLMFQLAILATVKEYLADQKDLTAEFELKTIDDDGRIKGSQIAQKSLLNQYSNFEDRLGQVEESGEIQQNKNYLQNCEFWYLMQFESIRFKYPMFFEDLNKDFLIFNCDAEFYEKML